MFSSFTVLNLISFQTCLYYFIFFLGNNFELCLIQGKSMGSKVVLLCNNFLSCRFRTTWWWVKDDRIFIFKWTIVQIQGHFGSLLSATWCWTKPASCQWWLLKSIYWFCANPIYIWSLLSSLSTNIHFKSQIYTNITLELHLMWF